MEVSEKLGSALEFIEQVNIDDDPYDLIVAREQDDDDEANGYEFKRTKLSGNLPAELGDFTKEKIENKRDAINEGTKEESEYTAANISDQTDYVQYISPDEVPKFEQYQDLLTTHEFPSTDYITDEEIPEFQVILIRDGTEERLLAFQDVTQSAILGKKDKIRFYSNDNYYKEIENTIVEIPNRIDAVYYDGALIIFSQRNFEKIFDYMDEFDTAAEETVNVISESDVPVHTDETFLDAVTSYPNAARIFYTVRDRELWEHENVDMDTFDYIIDEFDLSVQVEEREGQEGIVLEDKRNVWEVIHLYNDDHLSSPITEVGYQVDGKDARTNEIDNPDD